MSILSTDKEDVSRSSNSEAATERASPILVLFSDILDLSRINQQIYLQGHHHDIIKMSWVGSAKPEYRKIP
ncbi:hypothetical protein EMIT0194MI4_30515 [Pseudomonas sp. IT-194MI4]